MILNNVHALPGVYLKEIRGFPSQEVLETELVPDTWITADDEGDYWCNLCPGRSGNISQRKQAMWVCCGVIACAACITEYYLYDNRARCPWCKHVFEQPWAFKDMFCPVPTSSPICSVGELVNVHSTLADKGLKLKQ